MLPARSPGQARSSSCTASVLPASTQLAQSAQLAAAAAAQVDKRRQWPTFHMHGVSYAVSVRLLAVCRFPHCLFMLELLQSEHFREAIASPQVMVSASSAFQCHSTAHHQPCHTLAAANHQQHCQGNISTIPTCRVHMMLMTPGHFGLVCRTNPPHGFGCIITRAIAVVVSATARLYTPQLHMHVGGLCADMSCGDVCH